MKKAIIYVINDLVKDAQVNLMLTFQATDLKLKLLNSLYQEKFCICNSNMLSESSIHSICSIADSAVELKAEVLRLSKEEFSQNHIKQRIIYLEDHFSNRKNVEQLLSYLKIEKK